MCITFMRQLDNKISENTSIQSAWSMAGILAAVATTVATQITGCVIVRTETTVCDVDNLNLELMSHLVDDKNVVLPNCDKLQSVQKGYVTENRDLTGIM